MEGSSTVFQGGALNIATRTWWLQWGWNMLWMYNLHMEMTGHTVVS